MDEPAVASPKKTTRAKKPVAVPVVVTPATLQNTKMDQVFDDLFARVNTSKEEFNNLQKEIAQTRQEWEREKKQHEIEIAQRNIQEGLERKREQETYQYETFLTRKRAEDEFNDKKLAWEKDLSQRKQELENQKRELEGLKKLADSFDNQKEQAVMEAQAEVEKELKDNFDNERKLREQEVKAEKEVLGLKIANLEVENSRLTKELEILKRSLDEAVRQVKEIAVKVIESGSSQSKPQPFDKE